MNKYKGTQTEKNLEAAFLGESGARNKYTYFASVAKKQGYEQISALFLKNQRSIVDLGTNIPLSEKPIPNTVVSVSLPVKVLSVLIPTFAFTTAD